MKVVLKNVSSKIQLEEIYEKVLKEDWHDLAENIQGEYGEYKLEISNDKRNIKVEVR